ncbi:MAG: CHAD domain-containing protein [Bryobacteraceae bacterium]
MDMREYAIGQVTNLLARFAFELRRALKSRNADSIHDLRVAGRRFDQALEFFAPFVPEREAKKVRKRLRRLLEATGELRNYDVVLALAEELGLPAGDAAARKLRSDRADAAREVTTLLKKFARRDFSSRWRNRLGLAGLDAHQGKGDPITVWKSARYALPLAAGKFFHAGRKALKSEGSVKPLHEFRLATKSFRYSLELFQPIYGPAMDRRLDSLRQLQQVLGEIHDYAMAQEVLSAAGTRKKLLLRFKQRERENVAAFQQYWNDTMDAEGAQRQWIAYLSQFAGRRRTGLAAARG